MLLLADLYKDKALLKVKINFKLLVESGHFYESLNSDLMYEVMCDIADACPIVISYACSWVRILKSWFSISMVHVS